MVFTNMKFVIRKYFILTWFGYFSNEKCVQGYICKGQWKMLSACQEDPRTLRFQNETNSMSRWPTLMDRKIFFWSQRIGRKLLHYDFIQHGRRILCMYAISLINCCKRSLKFRVTYGFFSFRFQCVKCSQKQSDSRTCKIYLQEPTI